MTHTRRMHNPLFGNIAEELRRQTSPVSRHKRLHSDFQELPIE